MGKSRKPWLLTFVEGALFGFGFNREFLEACSCGFLLETLGLLVLLRKGSPREGSEFKQWGGFVQSFGCVGPTAMEVP